MPVGLAAIVLTALFVPESRARARAGSTRSGSCWSSSCWCLTYGIIEGPAAGWGSAPILALFAVSAAALRPRCSRGSRGARSR